MIDPSWQDKERKGSKFLTEIRAGLTTFFTMAYIIAVNVSGCLAKYPTLKAF